MTIDLVSRILGLLKILERLRQLAQAGDLSQP
jgi:hypothetical protein